MYNIKVTEEEYCKLNVKFEADYDFILPVKDKTISLFKDRKVPGFRKGKADMKVISNVFKKEINETLRDALGQEAFYVFINDKELKPFGAPTFISLHLENDKFLCEFKTNVKPTFKLNQYKNFDIPKYIAPVSFDKKYESTMEKLRQEYGEMIAFTENDFVQKGDTVIISYNVFLDDVKLEDLCVESKIISTSTDSEFEEITDNVYGMKIDEVKEFTVNVSENSKLFPLFVGKSMKIQLTLLMASKVFPAPLDASLAIKIGFPTFEALSENVKKMLMERQGEQEHKYYSHEIAKRLVLGHGFEIPQAIALFEAQYTAKAQGLNWDQITDFLKEEHLKRARSAIKVALILEVIREKEPDTQLTQQELMAGVKNILTRYGKSEQEIQAKFQEYLQTGYVNVIANRILDDYTMSFLQKNCNIVE